MSKMNAIVKFGTSIKQDANRSWSKVMIDLRKTGASEDAIFDYIEVELEEMLGRCVSRHEFEVENIQELLDMASSAK
jgi:hypothetical protein